MALETGTYINNLVATNPVSGDTVAQGDDHLRLIKSTLKNTFPSITGAVTATQADLNKTAGLTATTAELNYVAGVTSAIQTQLNLLAPLASPALTGTPTAPTQTTGNNTTRIATTAFVEATKVALLASLVESQADFNTGTATQESTITAAKLKAAVLTHIPNTLGVSQSWQNLIGSRSTNTSYQNTTGRAIAVSIETTGENLQASSNGSTWISLQIAYAGAFAIIPANHYYRIVNSPSITTWTELR